MKGKRQMLYIWILEKTFDTVSDKTLLENLIEAGLEKNSVMWIENKH